MGKRSWDDFSTDVRKRLAKSHLAGRHPAPVEPPTINLVRIGDEGGCDRESGRSGQTAVKTKPLYLP
eukprot:10203466-Prorocentrum_lima.AAC.1